MERIPARDGAALAATVWRPSGEGPWGAVVIRTPYGRDRFSTEPWSRVVDAGYVLVGVDVRGRGDSEGVWRPWVNDGYDGYDVIEWVAAQPWCDGNVATLGGSYDAITQWWAAVTQPPSLRCMIPMAVSAEHSPGLFGRSNGVVMPYWLWWFAFLDVLATGQTSIDWEAVVAAPPSEMARVAGVGEEPWRAYLNGEIGYGGTAWAVDPARVLVPALVTNGLWDDPKTFTWWDLLAQSPAAAHHRLLAGAWDHAGNAVPRPLLGGVDVSAAAIDPVAQWLAFLDRWMRDGVDDSPPVRICRTGTWQWDSYDSWPCTSSPQALPLGGGSWSHDPASALWLGGGADLAFADAPLDPAAYDARDDVLCLDVPCAPGLYSGEPVLEVTVTQAVAGTVVAWLSDIDPSGVGMRFGVWPTAAAHPGGTATLRLDLAAIHHELQPGHRFRVSMASSFAPIYAHALDAHDVTLESATLHLSR